MTYPFEAECIENFKGRGITSLWMRFGDRIKVTGPGRRGWLQGVSYESGREGFFPAEHVQAVAEENSEASSDSDDSEASSASEDEMPSPPVDTPGQWVKTRYFEGHQSFGFISCDCGRTWVTAYAQPDMKSGCRDCEEFSLPSLMWQNDQQQGRDRGSTFRELNGHHDCARCQICLKGKCCVGNC